MKFSILATVSTVSIAMSNVGGAAISEFSSAAIPARPAFIHPTAENRCLDDHVVPMFHGFTERGAYFEKSKRLGELLRKRQLADDSRITFDSAVQRALFWASDQAFLHFHINEMEGFFIRLTEGPGGLITDLVLAEEWNGMYMIPLHEGPFIEAQLMQWLMGKIQPMLKQAEKEIRKAMRLKCGPDAIYQAIVNGRPVDLFLTHDRGSTLRPGLDFRQWDGGRALASCS